MTDVRSNFSRRALLTGTAAGAVALGFKAPAWAGVLAGVNDPWLAASVIRARVEGLRLLPAFLGLEFRQFHVTAYGARPCEIVAVPLVYLSSTTSGPGTAPATGSFDC